MSSPEATRSTYRSHFIRRLRASSLFTSSHLHLAGMQPAWLALGFVAWTLACGVGAYVPAHAMKAAGDAATQSNGSKFTLQWPPSSSFSDDVNYLLAQPESQGLQQVRQAPVIAYTAVCALTPSQGVLVHFSEKTRLANITSACSRLSVGLALRLPVSVPSLSPWIAFIQCDNNATNSSDDIDIFTYARDRGAIAAVRRTLRLGRAPAPFPFTVLIAASAALLEFLRDMRDKRRIPRPGRVRARAGRICTPRSGDFAVRARTCVCVLCYCSLTCPFP